MLIYRAECNQAPPPEHVTMNKSPYTPPAIVDLGDAMILTKGSYPSKPETFSTIDTVSELSRDLATLDDD